MNAVEIAASASAAVGEALAALRASPATAYDPENLRHVHARNDEVLEHISIGGRLKNNTKRLEKLFSRYTAMTAAEKPSPLPGRQRGRSRERSPRQSHPAT